MRSSARWTCPPADEPRRHRLGLGLLELLVAIAIVASIAAVALPWTWSRLNRATLPEAADRIAATLLLARAEAMRSGRLVEVVLLPAGETAASGSGPDRPTLASEGDRLRVRYFDPDAFDAPATIFGEGIELDSAPPDVDDPPADATSSAGGPDPDSIRGSWTVMAIPADLRLRPHIGGPREEFAPELGPPLDDAFASIADDPPEDPDAIEATERASLPVAIFLPDGVNVIGGSWWLEERSSGDRLPPPESDRRRRVRLDLDDAAGMPRRGEVERIVPTMASTES